MLSVAFPLSYLFIPFLLVFLIKVTEEADWQEGISWRVGSSLTNGKRGWGWIKKSFSPLSICKCMRAGNGGGSGKNG